MLHTPPCNGQAVDVWNVRLNFTNGRKCRVVNLQLMVLKGLQADMHISLCILHAICFFFAPESACVIVSGLKDNLYVGCLWFLKHYGKIRSCLIDTMQNYMVVIAMPFHHFEWGLC